MNLAEEGLKAVDLAANPDVETMNLVDYLDMHVKTRELLDLELAVDKVKDAIRCVRTLRRINLDAS